MILEPGAASVIGHGQDDSARLPSGSSKGAPALSRFTVTAYTVRMESLLFTAALVAVMLLALVLLAKGWVRSSRIGGYRATHGPDGVEAGPPVREDDDVRWDWGGGGKPKA